jgi:D-alanyl-D-alanine carboxypeptidase
LDQPLPVGALDQLALSLMALETWGYEHRFQTHFYTTGYRSGQRLKGDLVVVGGGDPISGRPMSSSWRATCTALAFARLTAR